MPAEAAKLKGTFAPSTKQRISKFLQSFSSFEPTLALLYGDLEGKVAGKASWSITAIGPRTVDDMIELYGSFGAVVCYELDGFKVLVPQTAHIAELDGGMLEFKATRLIPVVPSSA
jgi:hypothetical protein